VARNGASKRWFKRHVLSDNNPAVSDSAHQLIHENFLEVFAISAQDGS
jgi:hypothetical protein